MIDITKCLCVQWRATYPSEEILYGHLITIVTSLHTQSPIAVMIDKNGKFHWARIDELFLD